MRGQTSGPALSAVFVDYDNIYLSLKRKSEEAARRFARDAALWIKAIENNTLITPTNGAIGREPRRIVMNRCYGNPVPRRNQSDNSTDMSSFPFVRHHFLRAGFEIIDCPPLTAQLKNSSDIRMVMDVIDYLSHGTYFDEFVILSGDADFTPVLHRLRAHARRTVIYANEFTATPYTAISDGEVREADLVALLTQVADETAHPAAGGTSPPALLSEADRDAIRRAIIGEVTGIVRASSTPVPLEALADRAVRSIGHDRTVATGWAGAGGFRELLLQSLPDDLRISDQPPYVVADARRHLQPAPAPKAIQAGGPPLELHLSEAPQAAHVLAVQSTEPSGEIRGERRLAAPAEVPARAPAHASAPPPAHPHATPAPSQPIAASPAPVPSATRSQEPAPTQSSIQQSITRIHEACQAPPLAPGEYRALFEVMAQEINENNLLGAQTIQNILRRSQERGLDLRRDDIRFVMEVVSETDPWFEQGASANLFAGRFRNFVVARCRGQGLKLSADELDLIDAWFAGNGIAPAVAQPTGQPQPRGHQAAVPPPQRPVAPQYHDPQPAPVSPSADPPRPAARAVAQPQRTASASGQATPSARDPYPTDELPRIMRTSRFKG